MPNLLKITDIHGTARACGEAYGEAFEPLIMGFCKQEIAPDVQKVRYARACWKHIQKHAPVSAEFLQGEARGAHLALDHAVLLSLHEEIYHEPHCTAFVSSRHASRAGKTIAAMNWDWGTNLYPWPGLLRLSIKGSPRAALYHYPGLWACAGVNDAGLALTWTGGGYLPKVAPVVGVPTYVLIAEVMRRRSVDEALAYLKPIKIAGCFLFFLADATGAVAIVEGAAGKMVVDRSDAVMLRGNHYTCPAIVKCSKQSKKIDRKTTTTMQRYGRMTQLVEKYRGAIDAATAKKMLTDRGSPWPWVHQFPAERDAVKIAGMTIDSLFAVCEDRTLWTCRGGRVPGPWQSLTC